MSQHTAFLRNTVFFQDVPLATPTPLLAQMRVLEAAGLALGFLQVVRVPGSKKFKLVPVDEVAASDALTGK